LICTVGDDPAIDLAAGPGADETAGGPALMGPNLVPAVRGVGEVRPRSSVAGIRILTAWLHQRIVADVHDPAVPGLPAQDAVTLPEFLEFDERHRIRRGTVVGEEDDHRVLRLTLLVNLPQDPANRGVHLFHHGGVHAHACDLPFLLGLLHPG